MKILVAGDTHGAQGWCHRMIRYAKRKNIDTIVQVGDMGYWPHTSNGEFFLTALQAGLALNDINFYWLDGNHENFDWLSEVGAFGAEGFFQLDKNIFYIPRGYAWDWEGTRCLALGGAVSIDRHLREPGFSWWPQEMITDADVERAIRASKEEKVQVMFTHDAPHGVRFPFLLSPEPMSKQCREILAGVVEEVRPKLLIHGHYHARFSSEYICRDGYRVRTEGLGRDGDGAKALAILHLPSLRLYKTKDW